MASDKDRITKAQRLPLMLSIVSVLLSLSTLIVVVASISGVNHSLNDLGQQLFNLTTAR